MLIGMKNESLRKVISACSPIRFLSFKLPTDRLQDVPCRTLAYAVSEIIPTTAFDKSKYVTIELFVC